MDFKNIRLICSDIDGTIVDKTRLIHKVTARKINELRNKGYIFGLASGRPAKDLLGKYLEWGVDKQFDFLIGLNGVELYDDKTKEITSYNTLNKEWLKTIIEEMLEFEPNIHMYIGDEYYSSKETDRAWFSAFRNKRKFVVTDDLSVFYKEERGGIMFRCDLNRMPQIEKYLEKVKSENRGYVGFKTQDDMVEFSNSKANKAEVLKEYVKRYGIDLKDCMAFGDTTNDNEMLKCCVGVCMINGTDDTKACAQIITDKTDKEDGFVDFVDKYLMIND